MKSIVFALFGALILSACATSNGKITDLQEGMTKDEVIKVVGGPDGYQRSGDYEVLLYLERRTSTWSYFSGAIDENILRWDGQKDQRDPNAAPFVRIPSR